MDILRRVEWLCGLLLWLVPPGFVLWLTITAPNGRPRVVEVIAFLAVLLAVGLLPAWLIWAHSDSLSGRQLAAMWVAVLVLSVCCIWLGALTFFWAVFMLLAALTGSVAQIADGFHESKAGSAGGQPGYS